MYLIFPVRQVIKIGRSPHCWSAGATVCQDTIENRIQGRPESEQWVAMHPSAADFEANIHLSTGQGYVLNHCQLDGLRLSRRVPD